MSAVLNYFSKNKIHKNNNKNKRLFFSLFLLCLYLYFAYHTAHATENKLFERSNTPPPGFENLDPNAPETTLVSVFYGRKLILNTLATFTPKHIQFLNPSEIIQSFSGFETDKIPEITTALSGELSNHTENLCPKNKAKI